MKKFAAHYLLTNTGLLLKNGMAVAQDDGTIHFIDTKGELTEAERMIFHSGLLISAFEFIKSKKFTLPSGTVNKPKLFYPLINKELITLNEVIDLAEQHQDQFPEMNILQLLNQTEQALQSASFVKNTIPGLYLLSGIDAKNLHFTLRTRLKKVI